MNWPTPENPMLIPKWVADLAALEGEQSTGFREAVADGSIQIVSAYPE